MHTLLLDQTAWDLVVDSNGNIAVASEPYSIAQDAASAIRLFQGELYYDTTQGVAYGEIFGHLPPVGFMKKQFVDAALTVPGAQGAIAFISSITGRNVRGQVQVLTDSGQIAAAGF